MIKFHHLSFFSVKELRLGENPFSSQYFERIFSQEITVSKMGMSISEWIRRQLGTSLHDYSSNELV